MAESKISDSALLFNEFIAIIFNILLPFFLINPLFWRDSCISSSDEYLAGAPVCRNQMRKVCCMG
jgi:hypothetical protein